MAKLRTGYGSVRGRISNRLIAACDQTIFRDPAQLDAEPTLAPTVVKVLLAFWPSVVMAARQTTIIRASMTAYSTAVGPSSRLQKSTTKFFIRDNIATPLCWKTRSQ